MIATAIGRAGIERALTDLRRMSLNAITVEDVLKVHEKRLHLYRRVALTAFEER